jgi:hypothetical protein
MNEFYKYYIAIHFEDKNALGNIPPIGWWNTNYYIYEVEDHVISRLDLLKVRVVSMSQKVAYGWNFCTAQRDHIKVRESNLLVIEQIGGKEKLELYKPEYYKYYLTEDDIANGVAFGKIMLKEHLYRNYKNIWSYTKENYSDIYSEYFTYVYGTDDKELISQTENKFPKQIEDYKKYYKNLSVLVEDMAILENTIDSIGSIEDVHKALYEIAIRIDSFPQTILENREIKNV